MVVLTPSLRLTVAALAALLVGGTGGCSWARDDDAAGRPDPEPTAVAAPGDDWPTATAAQAGLDPRVLEEVAGHARLQGADCFLVARDGRVVVDDAWGGDPDDPHEVFSVTKSIASTLVGIAVHDGDLALDDRVSEHVAAWDEPEHRDITVRQLLAMTSGLERPDSDYLDLASSEDRTATALALPAVAEPGTVWAYSNGAVQVLDAVLHEATGTPTATFARTRLFAPLGMDRTDLHIDRAGNATLAFGATTTCRDLARLGELVLRGGRWGEQAIVDPDWFDEALRSSSPLNEGYGLLWWLNREGRRLASALAVSTDADEVVATGREVPGAPEDLVWALGLGDQILQVHPGTGTIVVRIGRGQALGEPNRFDQRATAKVVTEGVVD